MGNTCSVVPGKSIKPENTEEVDEHWPGGFTSDNGYKRYCIT